MCDVSYPLSTLSPFQSAIASLACGSGSTEDVFDYSGDIPVSSAQLRVYTAQSMSPGSTTYNVPYAFKTDCVDKVRD